MTRPKQPHGFTLMESVIAIAVVAVMLSTFLAVFGPASQGIRAALSIQEADRLASTLERELQILRETGPAGSPGSFDTAFEKAYDWIEKSGSSADAFDEAILLYNYRGDPDNLRGDGTMEPYTEPGGVAGEDFILQAAVRRKSDDSLKDDLEAVDGNLYYVHLTQLVYNNDGVLTVGKAGTIADPHKPGGGAGTDADSYPEAVIAVSARFYALPSNRFSYIDSKAQFDLTLDSKGRPKNLGSPLFTRNLGVRR